MDDTPELNRNWRATIASSERVSDPNNNSGHQVLWEFNDLTLQEHAPHAGAAPACKGCGEPWPCGMAETAMAQIGVHS
jgi:hypothetical protein